MLLAPVATALPLPECGTGACLQGELSARPEQHQREQHSESRTGATWSVWSGLSRIPEGEAR
jgi:hypothetical protein